MGFQTSYTFSKSLDDTSAVVAGYGGPTGIIIQAVPQDPRNPGYDKGLSTFDVTHAFTSSLIQVLPLDRVSFLRPVGQRFNTGWQVLNITTLTSGMPFTVYSGIQQTGAGAGGGVRPDQIATPVFSTSRAIARIISAGALIMPRSFRSPSTSPVAPARTWAASGRWGVTRSAGLPSMIWTLR